MLKTKIRNYLSIQRVLALFGLGLLIGLRFVSPLSAQAVTEGFNTDGGLRRGMIVKIKKEDPTKVDAVTIDTADQMHGVVVNSNDAPLTVSDDGQKVFVATTGHYDLLVSNQGGVIAPGDYITISSLSGIGMKAGSVDQFIVGRALSAFDGVRDVASTTELTDSSNNKKKVTVGRIQIDIGVAKNPLLKGEDPNVPQFLKKATEAIAGKQVNAIRIYIGLVVFCVTAIVSSSLMFAGIRSAIISIGRNPLSRKSIIRSMFQVILTGLIVFTTGIFGVYLILRL